MNSTSTFKPVYRKTSKGRSVDHKTLLIQPLYPIDSELRYHFNQEQSNNTTSDTLSEFSYELKLPEHILIDEFNDAGIRDLTPNSIITEKFKSILLGHLRNKHGSAPKSKIVLTRKRVALYEDTSPPKPSTILLLEDINDEFMYYISRDPKLLYGLAPRKFEEMVAKLFADRGHEVTLTKKTRDGGYDLLAKIKNQFIESIVLVECKRYSPENKVGVEIVRGLYGTTEVNKANQGLIITSSFFTKDAQQEKLRIGSRIDLKDYNDLVEWIAPYSNKQ